MISILFICSVSGKDSEEPLTKAQANEPVPEMEQVQLMIAQLQQEQAQVEISTLAIEFYLRDKKAAEQGLAPKGWIQPPIDAYKRSPFPLLPEPAEETVPKYTPEVRNVAQ